MAAYICSKPLQIMVALILANPEKDELYLVDWFSDAERISVSKALGLRFSEVKIFQSRAQAMLAAAKKRHLEVFIDSDIGFKSFFCMALLKLLGCKLIAVYEEGIGTYRNDILFGWRKLIFKVLGGSCYFGQSFLIGRVMVFDSDRYRSLFPRSSKKVVKIPISLQLWCEKNVELLKEIFASELDLDMSGKTPIRIYLTDWNIDKELLKSLSQKGEFYVKPHPHIREGAIIEYRKTFPSVKWLPASVPAELIFLLALSERDEVEVYHYGSSAVYYFSSVALKSILLVRA